MSGTDYRACLINLQGQQKQIKQQIKETKTTLKKLKQEEIDTEQAGTIIQEVAKLTQEQLQYHISELVTLALASVFDNPYEFEVEFVIKRKQTEVNLWFVRNGKKTHPLSASGGGAVDVAALALRVSLWALKNPNSRNVMILDEPFKNLSRRYLPKAGEMIKMLSSKVGIQIIMVAHPIELVEAADNVITVTIDNGASQIKGVMV